jgi:hypothetical protein
MIKPDKIHLQLSCSFKPEVAEALIPIIQVAIESGRADNCGAYFAARGITRGSREDGSIKVSIKDILQFMNNPTAEECREIEKQQEAEIIKKKLGSDGEGLIL